MSFTEQLDEWSKKTTQRIEAVAKNACQELVAEVQTPREAGGNMPVDTGFLVNSGMAALNAIPSGTASPANQNATVLVINQLKAGDRFVFGWVANYAQYMEARYAFMRLAAQNWGNIVDRAIVKTRNEYEGG